MRYVMTACVLVPIWIGCNTLANLNAMPSGGGTSSTAVTIYGDGSAGVKTVSADENLTGRNHQYTDFTIASGVTLTIQSGTVIRCTGSFINNGSIVVRTGTEGGDRSGLSCSQGSDNSLGITRAPEAGISTRQAGAGEVDTSGGSVLAGLGGDGISDVEGGNTLRIGVNAGGGGAAGISSGGGGGGGGLTVLAQTAVMNNGGITANGADGGDGAGGGGGGVVILASQTSVSNATGATITADGGGGGGSTSSIGPGGGGGGGMVHLLAPSITDNGTVTVQGGSAGANGLPNSVTCTVRAGGGGGGATAGGGGDGGGIVSGTPSSALGGSGGFSLQTLVDPTGLF
ncbi:MAG: hypothetical protein ACE5EX_09370 [Phycisphaerae bacterium]